MTIKALPYLFATVQYNSATRIGIIIISFVVILTVAMGIVGKRRGYNIGSHTIVRCRQGHLFSTIWVPGGSLKAVRLGWARLQFCPIGKHWSLVVPVKISSLSDQERQFALDHHDSNIP